LAKLPSYSIETDVIHSNLLHTLLNCPVIQAPEKSLVGVKSYKYSGKIVLPVYMTLILYTLNMSKWCDVLELQELWSLVLHIHCKHVDLAILL